MTEHIKILGVFINLIIGTAVAITFFHQQKNRRFPFLRPLFFHIIFYNLAILLLLVSRYMDINILKRSSMIEPEFSPLLALFLIYLLIFGMTLAMFHVTLRLREKRLTFEFRVTIWIILSIICLAFAFSFLTPQDSAFNKILIMFLDNAGVVFLLFEIYILCAFLFHFKNKGDPARRKLAYAFSLLYLSRYLFVPVALLIPSLLRGFVGFLYFNLIPIIWYKFYFLPFANSMRQLLGDIKNIGPVLKEFDLSKREQEIVLLVLEGKSNTQIEEELFISYNTVKNHIYNIFQKTGVKTRHQLTHLITSRQQKY